MTDRETQLEGFALDKFSIVEIIAAGGFAEVYRAHDQRLDVNVVIKVLKPRLADQPTVRRFRDEALSIAKLQRPTAHPNVIDVLDVGDSHGYHWLAMRLLHGETLAARLQRGALSLSESVRIIGGVGTATTSIIGTPLYMSPEQIKGEGLSHRSDIYSLGHVCYELTSGQPAFPHASSDRCPTAGTPVQEVPELGPTHFSRLYRSGAGAGRKGG